MVIFHSYVKLPEATSLFISFQNGRFPRGVEIVLISTSGDCFIGVVDLRPWKSGMFWLELPHVKNDSRNYNFRYQNILELE